MVLAYDFFAHQYNWTPRQVDELSLDEMFWLPVLTEARGNATEQLHDK
jgi:hypothetical protein